MTQKATTECGHLDALLENKLLDYGHIMNLGNMGEDGRWAPVLRQLKEGKDGRLSVKHSNWLEVLHCPICGEKVEYVDEPTEIVGDAVEGDF